ncbi:unnamed protein product [Mytilus coruscus]|uniref:Glycosyltransferase family 92 protein n=1 Tax=Mytilus coruscus TaxID=42192 RepID=A0A6J8F213_MYTCO|nr:unnamed protein product [Mytilus coruscus]
MEEGYLSESSDISDEDTSDGYSFDPMNDGEDLWASDTAEFFDSLGQPPEVYQRRFRNALIANRPQYCYSPCQIQTSVSETCGLYCAYYVKKQRRADTLDCKIKDRKECFKNYSYDEMKDIPWKVFRRPSPQGEHDQQVALYHCLETFQGYDFVANVDFDEFIVHSHFKQFKDYLKNDLMPRYPTAAGFTLNHSYFIEDWGVSGDGFLQISRFVKRLDPRLLNYKNIVIPSRIVDIHTHNLKEKPGYTRVYLKSHDMVVHHYRTCPTVAYWKDCLNFPKYKDLKMNHIRPEMEARVLRVLKELGLH